MNKARFKHLYQCYLDDSCSDQEREEFLMLMNDPKVDEHVIRQMDLTWDQLEEAGMTDISEKKADHIYQKILLEKKGKVKKLRWLSIAASLILVVSAGLGFFLIRNADQSSPKQANGANLKTEQILPGGNHAVLTLGDGRQIVLNDTENGMVATEQNFEIRKLEDGQLSYSIGNNQNTLTTQQNKISTPRGGQYSVVLPDGSKVWLNAESSISYTVPFSGKERMVKLTGEAYFEVSEDKERLFKVVTHQAEINVLGTHFNVTAYTDEKEVNTTLLEGSVKVKSLGASEEAMLTPGQQARVNSATSHIHVSSVDTEGSIAWKNGYFVFKSESLESIMRKLARWYNVEVEYKNDRLPKRIFGGAVSRSENISEVLRIMELTGAVHFKIEGRRVIVMP